MKTPGLFLQITPFLQTCVLYYVIYNEIISCSWISIFIFIILTLNWASSCINQKSFAHTQDILFLQTHFLTSYSYYPLVSSHADHFSFICLGVEISASEICAATLMQWGVNNFFFFFMIKFNMSFQNHCAHSFG